MAKNANLSELPAGLLGYPVLQAADILLPRATFVPVGKDNESHIELTREIAKRFNHLYGEVFPLPKTITSEISTLVGTDGAAKMSKYVKCTLIQIGLLVMCRARWKVTLFLFIMMLLIPIKEK